MTVEYIGQDLINAIDLFMKKNKTHRISDSDLCKILENVEYIRETEYVKY